MPPDWLKTIFSKTLIYGDFRLRAVNSLTARKRKYPNRQKLQNFNTLESFQNGITYFRKYQKPWNFHFKFHAKNLDFRLRFFWDTRYIIPFTKKNYKILIHQNHFKMAKPISGCIKNHKIFTSNSVQKTLILGCLFLGHPLCFVIFLFLRRLRKFT